MNPTPFGRYQLLEKIGAGGMAEVFRAKKTGAAGFERIVAIKRIHPQLVGDSQFLDMFIDEAKIAVQLHHANIAQVFDLGRVEGQYFIALEHIHGRDLKRVFSNLHARGESVPIGHACFIAMEMLSGLDYAHNQRTLAGEELELVHRDVSLQNVLVSFDGDVKLIDFGIAKATGRSAKTQVGFVKGKFAYMSPEQLRGLPVDRRSDVFSAGTVLYEMLTGRRLFLSESTLETVKRVRAADVPPARSINPAIPEELEAILERALAAHLDERYQTAGEFHDALEGFVRSRGVMGSRRALSSWLQGLMPGEYEDDTKRLATLSRAASENDAVAKRAATAFGIDDADELAEGSDPSGSLEILFDEEGDEDPADSLMITVPVSKMTPEEIFGDAGTPPAAKEAPDAPAAANDDDERTLVGFQPPPKLPRQVTVHGTCDSGDLDDDELDETIRRVGPRSRRAASEIGAGIVERETASRAPAILALVIAILLGVGAGMWVLAASSSDDPSTPAPSVVSAPADTGS